MSTGRLAEICYTQPMKKLSTTQTNDRSVESIQYFLYILGAIATVASLIGFFIVAGHSFIFPYIGPKVWWMRSMIIIAWMAIIPLLVLEPWHRYKLNKVHYAVLSYIAVLIIGSFFSVDPHNSWFSGWERMTGILTIIHTASIVFIMPVIARTWERTRYNNRTYLGWKDVWNTLLLIGGITALLGILQHWGIYGLNFEGGRLYASLGNPIYLGHIMAMFTMVALITASFQKKLAHSVFFVILAGAFAYIMLLTGSRGPTLALIGGLLVWITMWLLQRTFSRKIVVACITALALFIGIMVITPAHTLFTEHPTVNRLLNSISDGKGRIHAWHVAYEGFLERPIFGWGQGNFFVPFNSHLKPYILQDSIYETWFDNAHNIIMNILATLGITGLLAWLGIYITSAWHLWSNRKKQKISTAIVAGGVALLATDFLSLQFVFENASSLLLFYFIIAFIGSQEITYGKTEKSEHRLIKGGATLATTILVGFTLLLTTNVLPAKANHATLDTLRTMGFEPKKSQSAILSLQNENKLHEGDMSSAIIKQLLTIQNGLFQVLQPIEIEQMIRTVLAWHMQVVDRHPLDLHKTRTYTRLAQLLSKDPSIAVQLDILFKKMTEMSPNRQQLYYEHAQILAQQERYEEAEELIQKAIDINDKVGSVWYKKAELYHRQNKSLEARDAMIHAVHDLGFVASQAFELNTIAEIRAEHRIPMYEADKQLVTLQSDQFGNVPAGILLNYALAQYDVGLKRGAYLTAKKIQQTNPSVITAEYEFLREIPEEDLDPTRLIEFLMERMEQGKRVIIQDAQLAIWMMVQTGHEQTEQFITTLEKTQLNTFTQFDYRCMGERAKTMPVFDIEVCK